MMYSIEIRGAFDFLEAEVKIGTLEYERLRGNASFCFAYEKYFLKRFPHFSLSADLGSFLGLQASSGRIFSFLGDTLPDRWGRALIDKRERILAEAANKPPRQFDDFGYLVRIDDFSRMGALRFLRDGQYLGTDGGKMNIPPITSLESFIREAQWIEQAERTCATYTKEWVDNIWKPGSSLGGARPKLNVTDTDGSLWIAKIPSSNDTYDIALWEHFACTLARKAGIRTAQTKVLRAGPTPYHTLLSKRFDREGLRRIHFASALTLTGLRDGDGAESGKGYIDIVDAMAGSVGVRSLEKEARELYRRIAFSIFIGNHDDHFRNHGFLLRPDGWELSPAYDLNPTNMPVQSLLISPSTNRSSLQSVLEASDFYLIPHHDAWGIIKEVAAAVKQWRETAKSVGIPPAEQARFAARLDASLSEAESLTGAD